MTTTKPIDAGLSWYHTREYLTGRPLTPIELRALALAAEGLSGKEIAERLSATEGIVAHALHCAAWKLGTRGRAGAVTAAYRRGLLQPPEAPAEPVVKLTTRQFEVFKLLAQGLTDAEIAGRMYLNRFTVSQHVRRLRARLEARDRAHAVYRALETGAVRFERPRPRHVPSSKRRQP